MNTAFSQRPYDSFMCVWRTKSIISRVLRIKYTLMPKIVSSTGSCRKNNQTPKVIPGISPFHQLFMISSRG